MPGGHVEVDLEGLPNVAESSAFARRTSSKDLAACHAPLPRYCWSPAFGRSSKGALQSNVFDFNLLEMVSEVGPCGRAAEAWTPARNAVKSKVSRVIDW